VEVTLNYFFIFPNNLFLKNMTTQEVIIFSSNFVHLIELIINLRFNRGYTTKEVPMSNLG
jgi:hypothetical protein